MVTRSAPTRVELISLCLIALAILLGGGPLLVSIARTSPYSLVALAVLAFFQFATLRRNFRARNAFSRLLVTRDITFVAAILCAFAFVWHPARWSDGAAIAAVEFGLILEVLARVGPSPARPAAAGGVEESPASSSANDTP